MKREYFLRKSVISIALPITVQSLVQASFSVIDQIMTGQLGSVSVAGIGLGGKFSSLVSVVVAAVATAAGILFAQYIGGNEEQGVRRSFFSNLRIIGVIAMGFQIVSMWIPEQIMSVYSSDIDMVQSASGYLRIIAAGFLPMAFSILMSTLFRCRGDAKLPLCASLISAGINTGLNYVLIFGKLGMPFMGVNGAALATTIARYIEVLILLFFFVAKRYLPQGEKQNKVKDSYVERNLNRSYKKVFLTILLPVLANEFLWSMGENVYAIIYGHMGTLSCAAMTLTNSVQALMMGAMTGLSSAAGIIIGKKLGEGSYEEAYKDSKQLMKYGFIGATFLSVVLLLTIRFYVQIFQVEESVRVLAGYLLLAYALIAPIKVENMILAGGIIRSGGKTTYVMIIDIIGTWCIGVPLGIIAAFVWTLPIYYVYSILSLEECVRLLIAIWIFRKKVWMDNVVTETVGIKEDIVLY